MASASSKIADRECGESRAKFESASEREREQRGSTNLFRDAALLLSVIDVA